MALTKIPHSDSLADQQFVQITGPDGITTSFVYNKESKTLYAKESQVIAPGSHGISHIAEDLVPGATCDTPGLLSADDKCKLDALLQTRFGVLGFQGAGFPDDGGWMQGDIILAAGSEFISLERIGNVIRFTVDAPIALNCSCFRAGARILMANGTTKAIEDIKISDKVVTHKGRTKSVINLMKNHYSGLIYNWKVNKHSGESFEVTGNHPVMALQRQAVSFACGSKRPQVLDKPDWTEAKDLSVGGFVARRRSHHEVHDVRVIDILEELGDDFIEKDGFIYSLRPDNHSIDGRAIGVPRYLEISDQFLDLLGYYAAEGCASRRNGLRFTVHLKELAFGDIGADICSICCELFGLEPAVYKRTKSNAADLAINNVVLGVLFKRWFGSKSRKRFPSWIMFLPAEKQARILAALIKGDGYITNHISRRYIQLGLSARSLLDQALFMAERCGWEPSNQPVKVNNSRIRYKMSITDSNAPDLCDLLGIEKHNKKLSHELVSDNQVMHRLNEVTEEYFEGTVYNFEVKDDNSYIVDGIIVHNCETCAQIYWVQDETDVSAIRAPSCAGKLPGVNGYGELKFYLLPESTVVDPTSPTTVLNTKGSYPSLIFKRYDDSIAPGLGEFDLVLRRDPTNVTEASIGWAFTPGVGTVPECVWSMGEDSAGNRIRFELNAETNPGLLGALLYKGHLLTKKMAVIVDYTPQVLSTNQYSCRLWDTTNASPIGDEFVATNIWRYSNPEAASTGTDSKELVLDRSASLLEIGILIDIWYFQVGEVSGEPILRYFFIKEPVSQAADLWSPVGSVEFGEILTARSELQPDEAGSTDISSSEQVNNVREFERTIWGMTNFDNPLILFGDVETAGPNATSVIELNDQHRAYVDTDLPGLRVDAATGASEPYSERPVYLWNRNRLGNMLATMDIGRPTQNEFPPYDVLLTAPIDSYDNIYLRVVGKGEFIEAAGHWILVKGAHFRDIPTSGTLRLLSGNRNSIWNYTDKLMYPSLDDDAIALAGTVEFPGEIMDVAELLHQEYSGPCVRVEFTSVIGTESTVQVQFKVGTLDMSQQYEEDASTDDIDDYIRGMKPGEYAVSAIYTQSGIFTGVGTAPEVDVDGFVVYEGGRVDSTVQEFWNQLEIMQKGSQVWIWWNGLLIPPNTTLSAALATPVSISTPYFPVVVPEQSGKFGLRLWPGIKLRRAILRGQNRHFSEFTRGQLELA